jgi:uncharacterized protein (DUF1015 family)
MFARPPPEVTMFLRPFAALRPKPEHAAAVIAPPYDVVSTDEARALVRGRPSSFLHVSRPEIDLPEGSSPYSEEAYARGAKNLGALIESGMLVRDPAPSLYVYRMTSDGRTQTGIACVASLAAYEANRVRKHELTRPDKENDRVRNIETLNAQTGPVLCAYRANATLAKEIAECAQGAPTFEAVGHNDVLHSIWRVHDRSRLERLGAALGACDAIYIADGHHRAAAAARVARSRGGDADRSHNHFLVVVFPHDEMRILDYNRIVRDTNGLSAEELLRRIGEAFAVERSASPVAPETTQTFGMYLAGAWYRLRIRSALVPASDPVASLDVSLLQDRLLAPILGIGDPRTDHRIDFVGGIRGLSELTRRVDSGSFAVAFSLHATRMEQLMAVADAGRLMPPKSTWFEPKLADGLLSHVLD